MKTCLKWEAQVAAWLRKEAKSYLSRWMASQCGACANGAGAWETSKEAAHIHTAKALMQANRTII